MNFRSRRYTGYCERPRAYRDTDRSTYRYDPPISWPQRPSPLSLNFPGISIFWPMPMVVPIMSGLGGWGSIQWGSGSPYFADRRPAVNRYRYCEPEYRRCCERCGYYECRCERECCDKCGYYECRCEPECCDKCGYYECRCGRERCYGCGYYECRCERCAKCGQRECRCREYRGSRCFEFDVKVDSGFEHNYVLDIDPKCIDSDAVPRPEKFRGMNDNIINAFVVIYTKQNVVTITIKLDNTVAPDIYSARIFDLRSKKPIATLTLVVY
jgi:hypothetical protein